MVDYPNIFATGMSAFDDQTKRLNAFDAQRASKQAGAAIAEGNYTGGANVFNNAGMVDQAQDVQARQLALQDRQTKATNDATDRTAALAKQKLQAFGVLANAVGAQKEGARLPFVQQHVDDLVTLGIPREKLASMTEADLSDQNLAFFKAEIAKASEPYTLGEGQKRFDANNKEVAAGAPKPQEYLILPPDAKAVPKPTNGASVENPTAPAAPAAPASTGGDPGALIDSYAKDGGAIVTSGLRTPEHNAEVGGVPNSHHLTNTARDLIPTPGTTIAQLAAEVQRRVPGAKVIQEADHVHVQWAPQPAPQASAHAGDPAGTLYGNPKEHPAPSGYRWASGGALEAIPGGPADTGEEKHLSEDAVALVGAQYLRLGPDAMKNMGQGKAGIENKNRVMEWVARTAKEAGTPNPELVARFAQNKANLAALTANTKSLTAVSASEHTLDANFDLAMSYAKRGVGPTGRPVFDTPINKLREAMGSADAKNLDNLLTTTTNEYARILTTATGTGGGATSDAARAEAHRLINNGMTLHQLTDAIKIAKQEAANRKMSYVGENSRLNSEISGVPQSPPPPPPAAAPKVLRYNAQGQRVQ